MGSTPVDLFRAGNATSARLDHVRSKDATIHSRNGVDWVEGRSGGISTRESKGGWSGMWWLLPAGSTYDDKLLFVWNDHGDHWSWEPAYDMSLSDYVAALVAANAKFIRV